MSQDHGVPDPLTLGRSVVVGPGEPAPQPWSGCERVRVGAVDAEIADELGSAWRERRSVTIELVSGIGLDDPLTPPPEVVTGRQPWEWPVDLDLVGERLHHAIWANSVDGRAGGQGGEPGPRWRWAEAACELGATLGGRLGDGPLGDGPLGDGRAGDGRTARSITDGGADVVLEDSTPAVCDGGPLDVGLSQRLGMAVVHRISLEHGVLRPLGLNDPVGVSLAPDQLAAVAEPGGAARVIAPAGSGKTRVLTERARLLMRGWGLPPGALAMVAYNVRAAGEMRTRLAEVPGARVRTLNSLGLRLCGRPTTLEELEVRRLLGGLIAFPKRAESDPAAPWLEALGRVRLGLADPKTVEEELADVSDLERVARAYRGELADRNAVDFDEQVTVAIERLLGDPGFRWRSQRFARVLLVDEFQDLTPAHLLLIRLLSGPAGAVFGVGDDDQTIYGYAGATPRWLVDFDRWFPGAAMHSLEVNYRCPAPVVAAASNLLTRNAVRVPKQIRPAPVPVGAKWEGQPLTIADGGTRPASRSGERLRELVDGGASPADVAVLARVNALLAPVQVLLRHAGLPVNGGVGRRFLQRGGVRAALGWLAVATAPAGALPGPVLREAARRPKRGMSPSLLDLVAKQRSVDAMDSLSTWLEARDSSREADKVLDLAADVRLVRQAASGGTTAGILDVVRSRIGDGGLDASASALDQWSHGAIAAHRDDLDALVELAELESDPSRFASWLAEELGRPPDDDGITLASIHAVKGREWAHVVLHHVTSGVMPHRLAEDLEEERRVLHVGLTRCRSSVSVVSGSPASPFVAELAEPGQPPLRGVPGDGAAGGGTAGARPGRGAVGGRTAGSRPAGGAAGGPGGGAATPALAGSVGCRFDYRGHEHQVVEITEAGARALVGGGPATTTIPLGTPVTAQGRPAVLAHPRWEEAWERLRKWRTERSTGIGKPAFVVFDDKTLRLVAITLPTSEAGLLAISGIGPVKLESYGDELISIAEQLRAC